MNNTTSLYGNSINNVNSNQQNKTIEEVIKTYDYENNAITDIVNNIIIDAINKKSSDIHFNPTESGIDIRIRIDGELRLYTKVPEYVKKNMITRIKILAGMNITESRIPQDGAIKQKIKDKDVDLRVSSLPTNRLYNEQSRIRNFRFKWNKFKKSY